MINDKLIPCNTGVVLSFYDKNPYSVVRKTEKGIILGAEGNRTYKSNETGEIEEANEIIACAKVLAIGPKCENVKVGEDVFVYKNIAHPIPYMKLGYYIINEQNIYCRVVKEE